MTDPNVAADDKGAAVTAVALKLPPFWPQDPEVWFAQVEAQFETRNITQEQTKFAYVVAALTPEYALEVRDLIINPPAQDQYKAFRAELIKRTSESEQKCLHQLLRAEELGDRKPSQLLRRMRQLLGDRTLGESILKQLFLQRLPTNAQLILASMSDTATVEQLAVTADKIVEVHSEPAVSTLASATSQPSATASESSDLEAQVAALTKQVEALTRQSQERTPAARGRRPSRRSSSKSRGSRERKPRSSSPHAGKECYYHWRWGDKARICVPPCSFNQSNSNASE